MVCGRWIGGLVSADSQPAQEPTLAAEPKAALLARAQQLDASGKPDLAAEAWRQVLLADPVNRTALEGLIAYDVRTADPAEARDLMRRLRRVDPTDPVLNLPVGEDTGAPVPAAGADPRLAQAQLAASHGDATGAFKLYRQVFGDAPPREWALTYYDAEAAVPGGSAQAADGLRDLAQKYPDNPIYAIAYGRVLALDPKTRARGIEILAKAAATNASADQALATALLWDAGNPAATSQIAAYLKAHPGTAAPQNAALALAFAQATSARRAGGADQAAYDALHRKNFLLAGQRFRAILKHHPRDAAALAGMGFLAMQQQDFSGALGWLHSAERRGLRNPGIRSAITTCRFWIRMNAASAALAADRPNDAEAAAQAALAIEPGSVDARLLLAQIFAGSGRREAASTLYLRIIEENPRATSMLAAAWAGWLKTSVALGQSRAALVAVDGLPASERAGLRQNAQFLAALSQVYAAAGRTGEAEAALAAALRLPSTALTPPQRTGIALEYAALCVEDHHYDCADLRYRALRASDPASLPAWEGLVLTEHLRGDAAAALQTVRQMPAKVHAAAFSDPSFLMLLAGIEQSQAKLTEARADLLEAEHRFAQENKPPTLAWLEQLAGIDLALHQSELAAALYRRALTRSPDDAAAWAGLLSALHQAGRDQEAEAVEQQLPNLTREKFDHPSPASTGESETYFQTMASVEQSLGKLKAALAWLRKMDALAETAQSESSVDVQLQEAWLEYNLDRDQRAEAELERLRSHLHALGKSTANQRAQVDDLTANLAVRRATHLTAASQRSQAVKVLDTAAQQVQGNSNARVRLATGYLTAGAPATSIAIYQSVDMRTATIGDLKAAIGAAIETKRTNLAESWLQQALASHPDDAGLLLLAGEFARSKGNLPLAEQYLRAALAAPRIQDTNPAGKLSGPPDAQRQAALLLDSIRAAYSGWLGATAYLNHFIGTPGTTQLTDVELPVEASIPAGSSIRITAVARTVHVDSGAYAGNPGQPLGTLAGTTAAPSVPVTGVGGNLQLATRTAAVSAGLTPTGFPVMNFTAAAIYHALHNPWTISFSRDSIRQSQLAYAGLHDPAQPANTWGGVVANLATAQYALGNQNSGWYAVASAGAVTGRHVETNPQFTGDGGVYWGAWSRPSASLRVGLNFYGQHNAHDELFFTYGHGGYFSPQYFLLPAVPLTLTGDARGRLHYELAGSLGLQIFKEASAPYFPLDPGIQSARGNPMYPAQSTFGVNYGAQGKVDYLLGDHWKFDAFFSANNAAKYNQQIGGVSLHYLFRRQRSSASQSARWFPYSGLRPYLVPR